MAVVNTVEQHRQLRAVELNTESVLRDGRDAKAALFEALVVEHEAAVVPGEHLHPVSSTADEGEEVAGKDVFLPLASNDGS